MRSSYLPAEDFPGTGPGKGTNPITVLLIITGIAYLPPRSEDPLGGVGPEVRGPWQSTWDQL